MPLRGILKERLFFLEKALVKLPDNLQIVWELALIEGSRKNSEKAQSYAHKAWKLGKRDRESFLALIENSALPSFELKV